jgi:O-antigen/teichoic acid export membrane protein
MVSSSITCLLIPWSGNIVALFLGSAYAVAGPVLAIMFLYPVLQTMGQINGATLLASGHTRDYASVAAVFMVVSIPVTYLVQSPADGWPIRGLGGGALGMAIKMVGLAFVSVNVQAWILARTNHWKFDWTYPFVAIGVTLSMAYVARIIALFFWHVSPTGLLTLLPPFSCCSLLYLLGLAGFIWYFPRVAGIEQADLRNFMKIVHPLRLWAKAH